MFTCDVQSVHWQYITVKIRSTDCTVGRLHCRPTALSAACTVGRLHCRNRRKRRPTAPSEPRNRRNRRPTAPSEPSEPSADFTVVTVGRLHRRNLRPTAPSQPKLENKFLLDKKPTIPSKYNLAHSNCAQDRGKVRRCCLYRDHVISNQHSDVTTTVIK